jgi:hypothetical protein
MIKEKERTKLIKKKKKKKKRLNKKESLYIIVFFKKKKMVLSIYFILCGICFLYSKGKSFCFLWFS